MPCTSPSRARSQSPPPAAFDSALCTAHAGTSPATATSRSVARRPEPASGLLDGCDPLQRGDSFLNRRVGIKEVVEEAAVVLGRIVDAHRRHGVVELRRRLVVL